MGVLQIVFGLALLAAAIVLTVLLRRTQGVRRRLLVIVVSASLLPATGVALATLGAARDLLGLLDSPGVRAAVDGGVGLARTVLEREQDLLIDWADSLAAAGDLAGVSVDRHRGWELRDATGARIDGAGRSPSEFAGASSRGVRSGERPRRLTTAEGTALVYERPRGEATLTTIRVLSPELATDLARVEAGSQGLQQLGLYYRELLGTRLLVLATIALLCVVLLSMWLGRLAGERLVVPLAALVDGTRKVAAGNLLHRVPERGVGEVRELAVAFNGMTELLARSEEQRRRSERLAAWQGVARRLAHEIKNPLTPIQLALHRVRRRQQDPVTLEALDAIDQETRQLQRLAEEFSTLGRLPEPQPQAVLVRRVLEEVVALYVPDTVEVRWSGQADPLLRADRGQLRQVLANLVKNAVDAMARRGTLLCSFEAVEAERARWAVQDDGPGLPEPAARVFEPGFTTRETGSGLGLAIVQRIVEDHGATIQAESVEGGGARFVLNWPTHPGPHHERLSGSDKT